MKRQPTQTARGQEIREALGTPYDEEMVAEILRTGASPADILEAREWLSDDDYMGGDLGKSLNARVRGVYEILRRDRDKFEPHEW